jgi:phage-related tail protein
MGIPNIPAFAKGTNNAPGGISLVGEKGPELVNLKRGSTVKTADETRKILGGRQEINIEINIENSYGGDDLLEKIGPKLVTMLKQALPNVATS